MCEMKCMLCHHYPDFWPMYNTEYSVCIEVCISDLVLLVGLL